MWVCSGRLWKHLLRGNFCNRLESVQSSAYQVYCMFRFNLVCSPEMSVCDQKDVESLPHAFVQFDADEVKAYVPLNFIMRYPTEWRTKSSWDNTYLYKVFWSQDPDDSPTEMAKRVAKIPVYEKGSSLEKPGYYRASVLAVDGELVTSSVVICTYRSLYLA